MKTIGLLGGMSWESTVGYYQAINQGVKKRLGGFHSAKIILYSVDFDPIEKLQHSGDWEGTGHILTRAARSIEAGGADFLLICTNTMHKVADVVAASVTIPLLHIADATAEVLLRADVKRVGLLGTAFTMEQAFYKGRLEQTYGLDVIIPEAPDRRRVHDIIYHELCMGMVYAVVQGGLSGDCGQARSNGRPGGHPGMHGNRHADRSNGYRCSHCTTRPPFMPPRLLIRR